MEQNDKDLLHLIESESKWYSVAELAKMLHVTPSTVYRWLDEGLEHIRAGSTIRIPGTGLQKFIGYWRGGVRLNDSNLRILKNGDEITSVLEKEFIKMHEDDSRYKTSRAELAFFACIKWIENAKRSLRFVNSIRTDDWFSLSALDYLCVQRDKIKENPDLKAERIIIGKPHMLKLLECYLFIWLQQELDIEVFFLAWDQDSPASDFALIDGEKAYICKVSPSNEITELQLFDTQAPEVRELCSRYEWMREKSDPINDRKEYGVAKKKYEFLLSSYMEKAYECILDRKSPKKSYENRETEIKR